MWESECRFLVVDAQALTGARGARACAQTGRYRKRCQAHVAMRTVLQDPGLPAEVGREAAWAAAARPLVAEFIEAERVDEVLAAAVGEHITRRWEGGTMDRRLCGHADRIACERALHDTVQRDFERVGAREVCAAVDRGGDLRPAAAAAGATPWDPELDDIVQRAWSAHCRQ